MSILGRKISAKAVTALALLLVVVALLPVMTTERSREIALVAREMAFYLETGPDTPNPDIEVRAGERIRITLYNDDRGFLHDFSLPAASAATETIGWNEQSQIIFDAPTAPGSYEYNCRPHSLMMKGTLRVVP
jgi:plastocyanin